MSYRTICVSLGMDDEAKSRLSAACELAHVHQARLRGCFADTWSDVAFRERRTSSLDHARTVLDAAARESQLEFEAAVRAAAVSGRFWRKDRPTFKTADLVEATFASDLCILSKSENAGLDEGDLFTTLPENIILAAGCPVLVLPNRPRGPIGRNVLVAWKPRREAARALRDALPLLHKAESVTVFATGDSAAAAGFAPVKEFLDAHQIAAEFFTDPSADSAAGEVVLRQAGRLGHDTLVMGAYGHARMRELILGGATRHVLKNAEIPVLMSH